MLSLSKHVAALSSAERSSPRSASSSSRPFVSGMLSLSKHVAAP
jgi:hypothetical protein